MRFVLALLSPVAALAAVILARQSRMPDDPAAAKLWWARN